MALWEEVCQGTRWRYIWGEQPLVGTSLVETHFVRQPFHHALAL